MKKLLYDNLEKRPLKVQLNNCSVSYRLATPLVRM